MSRMDISRPSFAFIVLLVIGCAAALTAAVLLRI